MLSRKSLTNNGTTKRTKQAVAGQARKVAGGAGCWMLDAGWTRAAEGARAEACPPTARRPALQREVGRRVPSFCRLSDGRLRWMFRLMSNLQDVGGRSKRRKRAPISQRRHTHLPDGQTVDTVPRCLPFRIACVSSPELRSNNIDAFATVLTIVCRQCRMAPPSPHPAFPSLQALGLIPPSLPSLQRQHRSSIRRHGPRINSSRGTVTLDRLLGHKAENGMMSRGDPRVFIGAPETEPSTIPPSENDSFKPGARTGCTTRPPQLNKPPFGRMETASASDRQISPKTLPHVPFCCRTFFLGADVRRLSIGRTGSGTRLPRLFPLGLAKRPRIFEFIEPRAQTGHKGHHHRRQRRPSSRPSLKIPYMLAKAKAAHDAAGDVCGKKKG